MAHSGEACYNCYVRLLYFKRLPKVVTHPSTNRAQCRVTSLIKTNTLAISYAAIATWVSQKVIPKAINNILAYSKPF